MLRLATGEIVQDTFVRFDGAELVCEVRSYEVTQVEYVRRSQASEYDRRFGIALGLFAGIGIALIALGLASAPAAG